MMGACKTGALTLGEEDADVSLPGTLVLCELLVGIRLSESLGKVSLFTL